MGRPKEESRMLAQQTDRCGHYSRRDFPKPRRVGEVTEDGNANDSIRGCRRRVRNPVESPDPPGVLCRKEKPVRQKEKRKTQGHLLIEKRGPIGERGQDVPNASVAIRPLGA